jgi:ribosomal protein S18 acetylase RimI-like enzyme
MRLRSSISYRQASKSPLSLGPSTFVIRTATSADFDDVLALWRFAGDPTPTDSQDALAGLLERDPEALLLACEGGELVGTLIAAWDGWRGSLYRLAVHPECRRQGIATELVRAGEERLREAGAIRLTAIVVDGDAGALGLWAAAGYERQAKRARFVRMLDAPG